jgi:small GTP-binding protein
MAMSANIGDSIRTPCCAVLGHVDVGKTKLLDYMRHSTTEEAAGITQQIGTTLYNKNRLEKLVGPNLKNKFNIDSLLMIDTPGHECFDMIRYVALKVADVVILMVDILKGLEKQTLVVMQLLKIHNVPFIICVNKIDRISGWVPVPANPLQEAKYLTLNSILKRIQPETKTRYDDYIRKIQNKLYEFDVMSELYYQNKSPVDTISIVPISAKTGEGIPDLIMLISTMAERRYLADDLIDNNITHGYILDSHFDKHFSVQYYVSLHRKNQLKKNDIIIINSNRYEIKYILTNPDNKEIKDEHRFSRVNDIRESIGCGLILGYLDKCLDYSYCDRLLPSLNNKGLLESSGQMISNTSQFIEPSSLYILENDYDILMKEYLKSKLPISEQVDHKKIDCMNKILSTCVPSYQYEEKWTQYLCPKGKPGIQVIASSHIMMDGLLYMLKSKNVELIHEDTPCSVGGDHATPCSVGGDHATPCSVGGDHATPISQISPHDNTFIERYKIGKIDKKDIFISGKWLDRNKDNKQHMEKYSIILSYDPSMESLPSETLDMAKQYGVEIIHSDIVHKLVELYAQYISKFKIKQPSAKVQIIPRYVFRTSDPMICGVVVLDGVIKIDSNIYIDTTLSTNMYIGKIESMQIDKINIVKAIIGQEVCLKIQTKKMIDFDFKNNAILYVE